MTMTPIELPAVAHMQSSLARVFQAIAMWHEKRHQRAMLRASLKEVPEHLRRDIGLDGGASLRPSRGSGRILDHNVDPALRQWGW
ncbi:hypothetical protein FQV27_11525 [Paracoccus aurantiacus]|uniref:DUF1127 domain-containing protein n=1 Tax=Paracoccus aurantiacus TaxID=2599412 RepID=A0A5C6S457_9RHOB|nr:hypothetical protein [Paracoccus aurantiacus]TXB68611.1 hypothetical protein FQV27_11525 [Paracoccus aurantiacus]